MAETARAGAEIRDLSLGKIVSIALKGLRVRLGRNLLVVTCVVLAVAFLSYILLSDLFLAGVATRGTPRLVENLVRAGILDPDKMAGQRVESYWMAGLAVLISLVGIINAMLMSVSERFREIGTMKCLGALDSFVLKLFLVESVLIGLSGTAAGIVLGLALTYGEGLARYGREVFRLAEGSEILFLLALSAAGGVVLTILGALYPASRAAQMKPIAALRSQV